MSMRVPKRAEMSDRAVAMASKQNPSLEEMFAPYYYKRGGSPPRPTMAEKKQQPIGVRGPRSPNPRPAARLCPRASRSRPVTKRKSSLSMRIQPSIPPGVSFIDFLKTFTYTGPSARELMAERAAANPTPTPNPPPSVPPRAPITEKMQQQMPESSVCSPSPQPAARTRLSRSSAVTEKNSCLLVQTQSPFPPGISPIDFLKSYCYKGRSGREIMALHAAFDQTPRPNPSPLAPPRPTITERKKQQQMPESSVINPDPPPAARPCRTRSRPVAEKKSCSSTRTQSSISPGVSFIDYLKTFTYTGPSARELMAELAAANPTPTPNPPLSAPPSATMTEKKQQQQQMPVNSQCYPSSPLAACPRLSRSSPVTKKKSCSSMQTQSSIPPGVSFMDNLKTFTYNGPNHRELMTQQAAANPTPTPNPPPPAPPLSVPAKRKQTAQKRKQQGSQDKQQPKRRRKSALLTAAEKWSDKYLRVPDDCLVEPPRSPHNLLQEKYASDPWKVIVICMLLNVTTGKQVSEILDEFFDLCPDARTAAQTPFWAIAKVIKPLGLQWKRSRKIICFSRSYLRDNWTHVTELHGVGKYAADAYAIFCAGKAREVVPKDHKLVDYWKFVCGLPETKDNTTAEVLFDKAKGKNSAPQSSDMDEGNMIGEEAVESPDHTAGLKWFSIQFYEGTGWSRPQKFFTIA